MKKNLLFVGLAMFIKFESGWAQAKKTPPVKPASKTAEKSEKQTDKAQAAQGRIKVDGSLVYAKADFDAEVIAELSAGETYEISKRVYGAFHAIRLKDGRVGYIADIDVKPLSGDKNEDKKSLAKKSKKNAEDEESKPRAHRQRSVDHSKVAGLQLVYLRFREDTMGLRPTENILFYGVKVSGPNLALEGPIYTDMNFIFHSGAPKYYEDATGYAAQGFILFSDFTIQFVSPSGFHSASFWGFGPFFKYSRIETSLLNPTTSTKSGYAMEDIGVGLKFNIGYIYRVGAVSMRVEVPYYWEKMHHYGLATSAQMEF